ncbi:MAG: alpha-ketoacid dehydrogenase subunit beta [Candidatus Bathyarchaeia archaeon]
MVREISYAEALNEALREEMERDDRVIVFGEDVGVFGGVYKVTKGLLEKFGPERVRDTPISEAAIVGAAIGAALAGLKPVAEIMYMDFITIAMDQMVTHAAKIRFMSGGQVSLSMVVRTQYSLGRVHGCQHSQFLASWFLNVPGLKVVLPGTPKDAKGLLKSAIRGEDPVLFVEAGVLYSWKGPVPEEEYLIPIGQAEIKRKGSDLTIVAFSRTVREALAAADRLAVEGIDAEVVDLMTLNPLDVKTLVDSVKKTNRLLVADDSTKTGGISAEIISRIVEEAFDYLDAPPVRVSSPDLPVPFAQPLENQYLVSADKICEAARRIVH